MCWNLTVGWNLSEIKEYENYYSHKLVPVFKEDERIEDFHLQVKLYKHMS